MTQPLNVLFLCTGNSARSILAEGILNALGAGQYKAYSAGSKPTGTPNPGAIERLTEEGIDPGFARSKSWDEFAAPGAPQMDYIFTVCDAAAAETCPYWPGHPASAHWGLPDPAEHTEPQARRAAFASAYAVLKARIEAFLALPLAELSPAEAKAALAAIGHMQP